MRELLGIGNFLRLPIGSLRGIRVLSIIEFKWLIFRGNAHLETFINKNTQGILYIIYCIFFDNGSRHDSYEIRKFWMNIDKEARGNLE